MKARVPLLNDWWIAGKIGMVGLAIIVPLTAYSVPRQSGIVPVIVDNPTPVSSPKQPSPVTPPTSPATSPTAKPATPTPATTASPIQPVVAFAADFSGADRILTNEFVHWNASTSCPYRSNVWEMTSGTLLIKNGMGYSGNPTNESTSVCESAQKNNSATFRLNTKANNFGNIRVSLDYMVTNHVNAAGGFHSYDGLHVWVGYQSEYSLYSATIFRWDTVAVIKKKTPLSSSSCSEPSNGGCYVSLSSENKSPSTSGADTWHHAEIVFTSAGGTTTLVEIVDGVTVAKATDTGTNGAAFASGAVGIRGDNSEFYIKSFTVTRE